MDKDNIVIIRGCVPYFNKKQKKAAWRELKQDFGDKVKILIEDGFLSYSIKVDRNYII